jgi:hypothetical protein
MYIVRKQTRGNKVGMIIKTKGGTRGVDRILLAGMDDTSLHRMPDAASSHNVRSESVLDDIIMSIGVVLPFTRRIRGPQNACFLDTSTKFIFTTA